MQTPDNQKLFPKYEEELQHPILHDELMNRATGQIYQNKTGKTMTLIINCSVYLSQLGIGELDLFMDSVTPPVKYPVSSLAFTTENFAPIDFVIRADHFGTIFAIIPNNYYYQLQDNTTSGFPPDIFSWLEIY